MARNGKNMHGNRLGENTRIDGKLLNMRNTELGRI